MESSNIQKKIYHCWVPIIYYCIVAILIGMIICNIVVFGDKKTDYGLGKYIGLMQGWVDQEGNPFDFENMSGYLEQGDEVISVFYTIPSDLQEDQSLIFRSKNTAVEVLIDGVSKYSTCIYEGPFYNRSPGTRWNFVTVKAGNAGKVIEIKIKIVYRDGRSKLDQIYWGERGAMLVDLFHQKGLSVLLCYLMFVSGLIYYIAGAVLNYKQKEKDYSLMYLASFATISAVWCLIETNILQFFFDNIRVLELVGNVMLVLGGMPLFLYMDSMYGIFKYRLIRYLCLADLIYIAVSSVFHIFGLFDYHQTKSVMFVSYASIIIILGVCLIRQTTERKSGDLKGQKRVAYIMQQLGMTFLWICVSGDLFTYLLVDTMDRAYYVRMGLMTFIFFFGYGNIYRLIELVKQGLQTELISSLAYTDGLTGIGNRTAYMEHLERVAGKENSKKCAIVIFDINDLKQVNDSEGHAAGDYLIRTCADIIKESFIGIGEAYRIGGDEFAVIMMGENVVLLYEYAINQFKKRMSLENGISIAYGVGFSRKASLEHLHRIEKEADQKMYEHKKRYKNSKMHNIDDIEPIC